MLSLSPGSSHRDPQFVPGCSHVFPPCSRFAAISHGQANYFQDDTVSFRISNVKHFVHHQRPLGAQQAWTTFAHGHRKHPATDEDGRRVGIPRPAPDSGRVPPRRSDRSLTLEAPRSAPTQRYPPAQLPSCSRICTAGRLGWATSPMQTKTQPIGAPETAAAPQGTPRRQNRILEASKRAAGRRQGLTMACRRH